jgi:hypothetical protein
MSKKNNENLKIFFQKNEISQIDHLENSKNEWIPFFNTLEPNLETCICGHKVKHITYLFNKITRKIIFIGTSCSKKYVFFEKNMKNDFLLYILREQISHSFFEKKGNTIFLEKDLGELLEKHIFEKFSEIIKKYKRDMDENIYYFDVFIHLYRMKTNILELIEYGYDFNKYYQEILDVLKEREIYNKEIDEKKETDSETDSIIIERLNKIEEEISQLLDNDLGETKEIEDLEENLKIEEDIKKELEEKEAEENLEFEERQLEKSIFEYMKNIMIKKEENQKYYSEKDLKRMIKIHDLKNRVKNLKKNIEEYKKDFSIFKKNLEIFKERMSKIKS